MLKILRTLVIDEKKCTGCRRCELACSFHHFQTYSLNRTRVHVVCENLLEGPVVCVQCGSCQNVCPVKDAIIKDKKTSAFLGTTKCDIQKCSMECINVCPYGVIHIDSKLHRAIKCDFCGGSPQCVTQCSWKAINYLDVNSVKTLYTKRISELRKVSNL